MKFELMNTYERLNWESYPRTKVRIGKWIEKCLVCQCNDNDESDLQTALPEIRLMMQDYNKKNDMHFQFVGCYSFFNERIKHKCEQFIAKALSKIEPLEENKFSFEVWDHQKLVTLEDELGLRVLF